MLWSGLRRRLIYTSWSRRRWKKPRDSKLTIEASLLNMWVALSFICDCEHYLHWIHYCLCQEVLWSHELLIVSFIALVVISRKYKSQLCMTLGTDVQQLCRISRLTALISKHIVCVWQPTPVLNLVALCWAGPKPRPVELYRLLCSIMSTNKAGCHDVMPVTAARVMRDWWSVLCAVDVHRSCGDCC